MVDGAADHIRHRRQPRPRQVAHVEEHGELDEHLGRHHPGHVPVGAVQLLDLRVLREDRLATDGVRLAAAGPVEVTLLALDSAHDEALRGSASTTADRGQLPGDGQCGAGLLYTSISSLRSQVYTSDRQV